MRQCASASTQSPESGLEKPTRMCPEWEAHGMRIGLHALGIGPGADPVVIEAVAREAEVAGFSTLWSGEHVVMVDRPDSPYPYTLDGKIAVPSDADWLDPLVALAFVAAVTSRIRIATGILLLPQHNPVVVAKQAASLDVLSKGRFALGIGVGWSSEEFAALGVPFQGRARRMEEFVEAMRTLWRDDISSHQGEFVRFHEVRSYPKPVRARRLPVFIGGNSDKALDRVVAYGDGWYGFNLSPDEVPERVAALHSRCRRAARDPATVEVAVSLRDGSPRDLDALADQGGDRTGGGGLASGQRRPGRSLGDLAGRAMACQVADLLEAAAKDSGGPGRTRGPARVFAILRARRVGSGRARREDWEGDACQSREESRSGFRWRWTTRCSTICSTASDGPVGPTRCPARAGRRLEHRVPPGTGRLLGRRLRLAIAGAPGQRGPSRLGRRDRWSPGPLRPVRGRGPGAAAAGVTAWVARLVRGDVQHGTAPGRSGPVRR